MPDITEKKYQGDIIRNELPNFQSRKRVTILTGAVLLAGTILGAITLAGTAVSAAKSGGNTGNGTLTVDVSTPVRAGAKVGIYTVRFTVAASNNGTFVVEDPDGNVIGNVPMAGGAGAFDDDIKFAIADGSTDFIVGDGFDITVAAGSGKYKKAVYGAVDGTQTGSAILLEDVDSTGGDVAEVAVIERDAQIDITQLIYDASADNADKKAALRAGLEAKHIQFLSAA